MKEGASDFVLKPVDNTSLLEIVSKNLEYSSLKSENAYLKEEVKQNLRSADFITQNEGILKSLSVVDKVKDTKETVLITGESGVGKEVLAQYIHYTSNRKENPFVALNCAALDENLLLSELFGHEKGAFTGAHQRKPGKFELAHEGTLFLDEIGEMNPTTQAKLLRVLEEGAFERVGGTKRITVNVRVVCATNRDLERHMEEGLFRKDLFYRINVISVHLPPLRERREDIPPLIDYFIDFFSKRYVKRGIRADAGLYDLLSSYSWPGNVRELKNVINQTVLLAEGGRLNPILPRDEGCVRRGAGTGTYFERGSGSDSTGASRDRRSGEVPSEQSESVPAVPAEGALSERMEEVVSYYESRIIDGVLTDCGGNKSEAARRLEVTRKTLQAKLDKYGLG
jgi:DNA-binding NtrC family response regulator